MSYSKLLPMIAAVTAIGSAVGVHAASHTVYASEPVSVRVNLADLDQSSRAGAEVSLRRIHNAAKQICGAEPVIADLNMRSIYKACMSDAVDGAVTRLGNPIVAALNGGSQSTVMASNGH